MRAFAIGLAVLANAAWAADSVPGLRWQADLGAAPGALVVADVLPAKPGMETLVLTKSPGRVYCIDATGAVAWKWDAGGAALGGTPAYSAKAAGGPSVIVQRAGGLAQLNASTGSPMPTPPAAKGPVLWADLEGKGTDAPVEAAAAAALGRDKAATLIDANGPAATRQKAPLWKAKTPAAAGALALADIDGDGQLDLATVSGDPAQVQAYSADIGEIKWSTPLEEAKPPLTLIAADLERDGSAEAIVGDAAGQVYVLNGDGAIRWKAQPAPGAPAYLLAADIDTDGEIEVLACAGDKISALAADGSPKAGIALPKPLSACPALCDLAGDHGLVAIVPCGMGVAAIAIEAYAAPALMPWPMTAQNAKQTNALPMPDEIADPGFTTQPSPLLANGGFETLDEGKATPKAWQSDADGAWARGDGGVNNHALAVTPAEKPVRVASAPAGVDASVRSCIAAVFGKGAGARAAVVQWLGKDGKVLREDRMRKLPPNPNGWSRFTANELRRAPGAASVRLALESAPANGAPALWDEASITATLERIPRVGIAWNQAGYEESTPKSFVAWSSVEVDTVKFELIGEDGNAAFSGVCPPGSPIIDEAGHNWGFHYYRGDFTDFVTPGKYQLRVHFDGTVKTSAKFDIAVDQIWTRTFNPAMDFMRGMRAPDGGWREDDAGSPAPLAEYTFALAEMAIMLNWRFDVAGGKETPAPPLAAEAAWGAEALLKRAPLDTEPLALQAAALARAARMKDAAKDHPQYAEAARKLLADSLAKEKDDAEKKPLQFSAAMDLYTLSNTPEDRARAEALYPGPNEACIESLILYDDAFEPAQPAIVRYMVSAKAEIEEHLKLAANPFGIIAAPSYFGTTAESAAKIGNTHAVLTEALHVARAFRFVAKPELLKFIYEQFDWILGVNPAGQCLMAGIADAQTPRFATTLPPAKLAGAIANGFTGRGPGDDRPFIDSGGGETARATAGVRLRNTVDWLRALATIKRIRGASHPAPAR